LDKERIKAQGEKTTDSVADAEKQDGKMFEEKRLIQYLENYLDFYWWFV
jgi:hypothetical protein